MAKKREVNYFKALYECAEYGFEAIEALSAMMSDYKDVESRVLAIHEIEHNADSKQHLLYADLMRAFITPIDRDDILELGSALDNVTDSIDNIAKLFDRFCIKTIPGEAMAMCELIKRCTAGVLEAIRELPNFKHPKRLCELCVQINQIEEEGDRLHHKLVKDLMQKESNLDAFKWKEIYDDMEIAMDACENVADVIERLIMKNN
ncbi:MAG: putative pit accessory protein [Firmicutes bacterium ADurb.Bin182]|nr:MAG: putative pit accessory protein [Firmicutes bacterium ADurb.Bin182]